MALLGLGRPSILMMSIGFVQKVATLETTTKKSCGFKGCCLGPLPDGCGAPRLLQGPKIVDRVHRVFPQQCVFQLLQLTIHPGNENEPATRIAMRNLCCVRLCACLCSPNRTLVTTSLLHVKSGILLLGSCVRNTRCFPMGRGTIIEKNATKLE